MNKQLSTTLAVAASVYLALPVQAQTQDDLKNDGANTDNVLTYGMGYAQHRYSKLDQVNTRSVKKTGAGVVHIP